MGSSSFNPERAGSARDATLPERALGRYALYAELAAGGMATVHLGRMLGVAGFARTIAIKRLHPQYAKQPDFVTMFLDEARLAARIRHPNVVQTLDVVASDGELFLVMEYVHGESLSRLLRAVRERQRDGLDDGIVPPAIVMGIVVGLLNGLQAAHDATNERGVPLGLVHRDVSPHNVLVGADGITRALDFGIAKAVGTTGTTRDGHVRGKLPYLALEQLERKPVDRTTDVYAASVVLWEALTARRLFDADTDGGVVAQIIRGASDPPSKYAPAIPPALDEAVMRGLSRDPAKRFGTAREMAHVLHQIMPVASSLEIGDWVERVASRSLAARAALVAAIESGTSTGAATASKLAAALPVAQDVAGNVAHVGRSVAHDVATEPDVAPPIAAPIAPSPIAPPIAPESARGPRRIVLAAALLAAVAGGALVVSRLTAKRATASPAPLASQAPTAPSDPTAAPPERIAADPSAASEPEAAPAVGRQPSTASPRTKGSRPRSPAAAASRGSGDGLGNVIDSRK